MCSVACFVPAATDGGKIWAVTRGAFRQHAFESHLAFASPSLPSEILLATSSSAGFENPGDEHDTHVALRREVTPLTSDVHALTPLV